jgi:type IV pilus assembly protein PilY1
MKKDRPGSKYFAALLALAWSLNTHALTPATTPLYLKSTVEPNVMFTLDDSGSMQWEIMPESLTAALFVFPQTINVYGTPTDAYQNLVPTVDDHIYNRVSRSPQTNKIYYNPQITYKPWIKYDGTFYPNANPTNAYHNPEKITAGSRNLTVTSLLNARWVSCTPPLNNTNCSILISDKNFYPATYFIHNGGDIWNINNYTAKIEIKSTTATYSGRPNRSDCAGNSANPATGICTYAEEIQNFANWYTYYRSRILLARAGVGRAFAQQGTNMRVGFAAINQGSKTVDSVVSPGTVVRGVRPFSGTNRQNFFSDLYTHAIPAEGTPLRKALDNVGKYFERTDDLGPWGATPGTAGGTQLSCRQNYNILMTDGYWNGAAAPTTAATQNVDNLAGSTITGTISGVTATYIYSPSPPFKDSYRRTGDNATDYSTLADVAMYYWKRDLRTDLTNNVPVSTANPAFWQHMVNFTVGLGVFGTLNPTTALTGLTSGATAWPRPVSDDKTGVNIDDLWHAAVNSRGGFFSASDPETFASALSSSLQEIVNRTSSSSSVATSTTQLKSSTKYFQSLSTSGEWGGTVMSRLVSDDSDQWDAAVQLNTQISASSDTRKIITSRGARDGVAFLYDNLSATQKAALNFDSDGVVDTRGPDRVGYLRGHSQHEGTSPDQFRQRPNRKLGDIVNSNPWYASEPAAGYSDVDYSGYSAFRSTYLDRIPVVYVGANDGMLHGFNACEVGSTYATNIVCTAAMAGTEVIAYVPTSVYPNLRKLTEQSYNTSHLYYVDGSPMVGDAFVNGSWRSVLVGGLNSGGKGYYALDVTNPTDTSKAAPTFSQANAASLQLWEFTDANDVDLGLSYNLPPTNQETGQPLQITRLANGKWAAILGNGYNSSSGKAALFILFLDGPTGTGSTWTLGTDYIKLVAETATGSNGLSTPFPFDSNGDGYVDVVYAGDLKGNMWKFFVGPNAQDAAVTSDPATWRVAFSTAPLFSAINASNQIQPITHPPVVSLHPTSGLMVLFGTGKYLETSDVTSSEVQTYYGLRDIGTAISGRASLKNVVLSNTLPRSITSQTAAATPQTDAAGNALDLGWHADMSISGERITGRTFLSNRIVLFDTVVPNSDLCEGGVSSQITALQYDSGGAPGIAVFGDANGDGTVNASDIVAGVSTGQSLSGTTFLQNSSQLGDGNAGDSYKGLSSQIQGTVTDFDIDVGGGTRGRITWREILQ